MFLNTIYIYSFAIKSQIYSLLLIQFNHPIKQNKSLKKGAEPQEIKIEVSTRHRLRCCIRRGSQRRGNYEANQKRYGNAKNQYPGDTCPDAISGVRSPLGIVWPIAAIFSGCRWGPPLQETVLTYLYAVFFFIVCFNKVNKLVENYLTFDCFTLICVFTRPVYINERSF